MTEAEKTEFIRISNENAEIKQDLRSLVAICMNVPKQVGFNLNSINSSAQAGSSLTESLAAAAPQIMSAVLDGSLAKLIESGRSQLSPIMKKYAHMVEDLLPQAGAPAQPKNMA